MPTGSTTKDENLDKGYYYNGKVIYLPYVLQPKGLGDWHKQDRIINREAVWY
jgi:hypothetical protein